MFLRFVELDPYSILVVLTRIYELEALVVLTGIYELEALKGS